MDDLRFIQVGELAKGIRDASPGASGGLNGRSLELHGEDGSVTGLTFTDAHHLERRVLEGPDAGTSFAETYTALSPRDGIYLVDYVSSTERATSVSLVLDLTSGCVTEVVGTLPAEADVQKSACRLAAEGSDLTAVAVRFVQAAIDRPFSEGGSRHRPTSELVGKRVLYVYSPSETYEHIYLNEKLYTWHCLAGVEKGLADTDRCHACRIGEELYLFVWREKIVPTLGVVVVDWRAKRSQGKLFGYESSDLGALSNTRIAAAATLLNVTPHG